MKREEAITILVILLLIVSIAGSWMAFNTVSALETSVKDIGKHLDEVKSSLESINEAMKISASTTPPPPKEKKSVTLMTNYSYNGRHVPFFVGVEKGFYEEEGILLHITPSTGSAVAASAVDMGTVDFAQIASTTAIQYISKGANIKGFMIYTYFLTDGLGYLKEKSIKQPKDLEGKSVGMSAGDSMRVVLPGLVEKGGGDFSKVTIITIDPAAATTGLFQGMWDAIIATSDGDMPVLRQKARELGLEVDYTPFHDWGLQAAGYLIVTRIQLLESDPELVKAFTKATIRAVEYTLTHKEEAVRIMMKCNPLLSENIVREQLEAAMQTWIVPPEYAGTNYGDAPTTLISATIDYTKTIMELPTVPTPERVFTNTYLK